MTDLLSMHKYFLSQHIKAGDTVADFTAGNGHDTLWLAQQVGESGRVYAFDIQKQACENTRARLEESGLAENWTVINDSHANAEKYIKDKIKAGVFNLGYLPGGDKSITTLRESTKAAVLSAISLLSPDGILLVAVYPGHEEGELEGEMLRDIFSELSRFKYCAIQFKIINSPTSPYFYVIESKKEKDE